MTTRVPADFNNVAAGGAIKARRAGLAVGDRVRLFDHEGNECEGDVFEIGAVALVHLDLGTWKDGPQAFNAAAAGSRAVEKHGDALRRLADG